MNNPRSLIVSQVERPEQMQARFHSQSGDNARVYETITNASKKRLSRILDKATYQSAHFYPYIDVYVEFPPRSKKS
jgi:hypothetical protein